MFDTYETRTVAIDMDAVTQTAMRLVVGRKDWEGAIGYLSTWNMTFPYVRITCDSYGSGPKTDLLAVYYASKEKFEARECAYAIGAVWHGDHYGFHS